MIRLLLFLGVIAFLCGLSTAACGASGSTFWDPAGYFSTVVPSHWRLQVSESSDSLTVFYGRDTHDLLYVERLDPVRDETAADFAERVLSLYQTPYGPQDFAVLEEPLAAEVGGVTAARVVYEFMGGSNQLVQELRYFVLVGSVGFSITYANSEAAFANGLDDLNSVLASWRWLTLE